MAVNLLKRRFDEVNINDKNAKYATIFFKSLTNKVFNNKSKQKQEVLTIIKVFLSGKCFSFGSFLR